MKTIIYGATVQLPSFMKYSKKMEKSPEELLLDEGVMLEIPQGADEQAVEQTIENALELQPDKVAADMNKIWIQETGEGISEETLHNIKYKTDRVQRYAKRYVSQKSQVTLMQYKDTVKSLYRELERAKQHTVKHKQQKTHVARVDHHSKGAKRVVDSILMKGKTIRGLQVNEFDKAVRKMGGWQNNTGFQGMIKVLKAYSREKHLSDTNQTSFFDFEFLQKFLDKYALQAHSGRGDAVMWNMRRAFDPRVSKQEFYEYKNRVTRSLKEKRIPVDTQAVMKGIDPKRLAQRQREKATQRQQDREALQRQQTRQAKEKFDRAAQLLRKSKQKQAADLKARYEASQRMYEKKTPPLLRFLPRQPRD